MTLSLMLAAQSFEQRQETKVTEKQKRAELAAQGCFDSPLRVQMGTTLLALPRNIKHFKGSDSRAEWKGEVKKSKRIKARDLCQKPDDPALKLEQLYLDITPEHCKDEYKYKGRCTNVHGFLYHNDNPERNQNKSRITYLKDCEDNSYAKTCQHGVFFKDVNFYFQYRFNYYPTEDIEHLEEIILEKLQSFDITSSTTEKREP